MKERELIAERVIYAVDNDSRGFEIRLMIGKPYPDPPNAWACPVAMVGLQGAFPDMHGVDSWQALTLALQVIDRLLTYFVEDGGKLYWEENGNELAIEELFSGRSPQKSPTKPPLTEEEYQERIDALTPVDLQRIDDALMAGVSTQFRTVARVVGTAMSAKEADDRIPDYFYASRLRKLVGEGRLVAQGISNTWGFSEVKLPE